MLCPSPASNSPHQSFPVAALSAGVSPSRVREIDGGVSPRHHIVRRGDALQPSTLAPPQAEDALEKNVPTTGDDT
jgi:hypothetical protein